MRVPGVPRYLKTTKTVFDTRDSPRGRGACFCCRAMDEGTMGDVEDECRETMSGALSVVRAGLQISIHVFCSLTRCPCFSFNVQGAAA